MVPPPELFIYHSQVPCNQTIPVNVCNPGPCAISGFYSDKTNEQVLAAAAYAISNATTSKTTSSPVLSSTRTYTASSGSTIEGRVGSTLSISTSIPISTPITGFSWESIIVGTMLSLSVMVLRRGRKLGSTHSLASKYPNVEAKPSDENVLSLGA